MTTPISTLAAKAVEAQELFKRTGAPLDKFAAKLRRDGRLKEFHDAATPQAWLNMEERVAKAEADAKNWRKHQAAEFRRVAGDPAKGVTFPSTQGE